MQVGTDANAILIKRTDIGSNLGVAENGQDEEFRFYPNPAQNLIKFNKTVDKVSLISMDGKIIKEANFINEMSIEDISSGVYFLKFEQNNSTVNIKKLIKN